MRASRLLDIIIAYAILGIAAAYDFGLDVEGLTRRQDEGHIVVGRLPLAANGSVPHRLDIRQMRNDRYQWDLLILALSMFQSVNQSDPHSWYQIAAVHGVPWMTWNGVEPVPGAERSGYCTHGSVLFPIWHRPYLALVEQEIFKLANMIAAMFPDPTERRRYQQAAYSIRLPFWDWARPPPLNETHFPEVFWHPMLMQYGPRGWQNIRNPFYSYVFNPKDEEAFIWSPLKYWPETKRAPDVNISLTNPRSENDRVSDTLYAKLPELQQRLFMLFSRNKDFNSFSNKAWTPTQNSSSYDSIEAIHDEVHIHGGLNGHMTYVPLSALDPFFFVHHASVDRLITMWQILNPKAWISPQAAGQTSYNALLGDIQTSQTPLTPFYITQDIFWNSDMARDRRTFGYDYADTDSTLYPGQDMQEVLSRKIRRWYGGSSVIALQEKAKKPNLLPPHEVKDAVGDPFGLKTARPSIKASAEDPPVHSIIKQGRYTEWVINVRTNVEALDGRFAIHFFLGKAPTSCRAWASAPNVVGSVGIFAMDRNTGSQSKISGALPLTSALTKIAAIGAIPNLDLRAVEPLVEDVLDFHVCGSADQIVSPDTVDGLYIWVSGTDVKAPTNESKLPQWGADVSRIVLWS